jgi:hypothetical protein
VLAVKLFVSALFLAAATAAFAQNQGTATAVMETPGQSSSQEQAALAKAQMQAMADRTSQAGCPLYLESASVAPEAGYLPVTAQNRQDGALDLHFRNQSGKPIASASITARVSVKTNIYDLDAHTLQLRLPFSGTHDLDKTLDQIQHIVLPKHVYLFGVARVELDQVTFGDGSVWTAAANRNVCRTGPMGAEQIAK